MRLDSKPPSFLIYVDKIGEPEDEATHLFFMYVDARHRSYPVKAKSHHTPLSTPARVSDV